MYYNKKRECWLPDTIEDIDELVELTKGLTGAELTKIAYGLSIIVCSIYVHKMEQKHGIKISI